MGEVGRAAACQEVDGIEVAESQIIERMVQVT
jgi:hypothetical protein